MAQSVMILARQAPIHTTQHATALVLRAQRFMARLVLTLAQAELILGRQTV